VAVESMIAIYAFSVPERIWSELPFSLISDFETTQSIEEKGFES
jgi:hypothetical protein